MKLKKLLKQGKKETKKEQVKQQVQQQTKVDQEEQQRDDDLINIKDDLKKKQQPKPKITKRVQTNKLDQVEIDTSKYVTQKKQEVKPQITSWVVESDKVKDLLKQDFKLHEVEEQFESLTDTKLNQQLKQKKEKKIQEQKTQNIGQMKFAPLGTDPLESKTTDKLIIGKPKTDTQPTIGFSPAPALNFTNTKLGGGNMNIAPLQKPAVQIYDDDMDKKAKERLEQSKKEQSKASWFKKGPTTTEAPKLASKQAPKMDFKSSLTFTNSSLNQEQQVKGFQPIQKSKQQQIYQRKEQQYVFTNKKQQQERRKKRQEELKQQQAPISTQPKA